MGSDNKSSFSDDLNSFSDDSDSFESSFETKPQNLDYDVFRLRTDPTILLDELRMEILRQTKKYHKQGLLRDHLGKFDLVQIKGTEPLANEKGVEEILMFVRKLLNNHVVQGFTVDHVHHRSKMRYIADFTTRTFWTKRKEWGIRLNDTNYLIGGVTGMIDLFLTRTIGNKERESYSEQFKENTTREFRNTGSKPNLFSKMFNNWARR